MMAAHPGLGWMLPPGGAQARRTRMNGMVGYDAGSRGAAQQWPRWPGRDWVMEDDVTVRLVGDPRLDATEVQVRASRGQVTLTGNVVSQGAGRAGSGSRARPRG